MSNYEGKETDSSACSERAALEELLTKSRGTDIPVLLQAKELAKQAVRKDPSGANLAALQRADSMLRSAESTMTNEEHDNKPKVFKSVGDVLRYLQEDQNRQIAKSKLYAEIKTGLLRKSDKGFRQKDVDRYAGSLPVGTTPDGRNTGAEERLRRKDEADIRIKEAHAYREEQRNKVLDGQYVSREQVYQELAARAVAFNTGLKSAVQAKALDIIRAVGGDQQKTDLLARTIEKLIDDASNEYARELTFEVDLQGQGHEDEDEDASPTD